MADSGGSRVLRGAVAVRTLGCKVNRADSDAICEALERMGVELVASEAEASVVVVNTCTVTGEADHKARKAIRHALGGSDAAEVGEQVPMVVVTGCMAAVDPEAVTALGPRVVVEPHKEQVARRVVDLLDQVDALPGRVSTPPGHTHRPERRSRIAIKVQDGCDCRCSYCIVPDARGSVRSVAASRVVERVRGLVSCGTREVVLAGVNLGTYRDEQSCDDVMDLPGLVRAVAQTGIDRIRLSSIEPQHVTPALLHALSSVSALCPHLHIPLQSGSDRVLAAMRRRYTAGEFAGIVSAAREVLGPLAITTDVMVGFPGETEADFEDTLALCREVGFAKLHVFRYSPRAGTPAATMPDAVPADTSSERAARLRALGDVLRAEYIESRRGARAEVLVESVDARRGVATGTTEDYLRLDFAVRGARMVGELVRVTLEPDGDGGVLSIR